MASPSSPTPERKTAATANRETSASAASQETKKPTDSAPMATGTFAVLPAQFGRYRVERLLGRGAMGAVYRARDTQLDRLVALKIPRVSASGSSKLLKRLEVEAKAAAKLHHPNICSVYDYGVLDNVHFIAMQYVDGEDLKTWLKRRGRPLEPAAAIRLIVKLVSAVGEAHQQEIIHRDLKPENVMLKPDGEPVIMDFGLARRATGATDAGLTQGMIVGTAAYMSPEQANGRAEGIDHRSDIYALGVMLFELLTGAWPFTGSAFEVMGQKSVQEAPSPLSIDARLPPQLAAVCHKMIARKKEERYNTCADVIAALESIGLNATAPAADGPPAGRSSDFRSQEPSPAPIRHKSPKPAAGLPLKLTARLASLSALWSGLPPAVRWGIPGGAGALSLALAVILYFQTPYGVLRIEIEDPTLSVKFDGQKITVDNDDQPIRVTATSRHTLEVLQAGVTVESATRQLTLMRGEKQLIKVTLIDGRVVVNVGPLPAGTAVAAATPSNLPARNESREPNHHVLPVGAVYKGTWKNFAGGNDTPEAETELTVTVTQRKETSFTTEWIMHARDAVWIIKGDVLDKAEDGWKLTGDDVDLVGGDHFNEGNTSLVAAIDPDGLRLHGAAHYRSGARSEFEAKLSNPEVLQSLMSDVQPTDSVFPLGAVYAGTWNSIPPESNVITTSRSFRWIVTRHDGATVELDLLLDDPSERWILKGLTVLQDGKAPSLVIQDADLADGDHPLEGTVTLVAVLSDDGRVLSGKGFSTLGHRSTFHGGLQEEAPPRASAPFDAEQASAHQEAWAKHLGVPIESTNSIDMAFRLIPAGEFTMGSTPAVINELVGGATTPWTQYNVAQGPEHRVRITRAFYLGACEVTRREFQTVMEPSTEANESDETGTLPMGSVSWYEAVDFCNALSQREGLSPCYSRDGETVALLPGNGYRLPTEAEWEYACRAGTTTLWHSGDNWQDAPRHAWYNSNSGNQPHPVAQLSPNPFGLFDMNGNVWEWCWDWYGEYGSATVADPVGRDSGEFKIFRGGGFGDSWQFIRSASRFWESPSRRLATPGPGTGFRVVRECP